MHTWNIPAASEEQGSSSFKAYLEFLDDQVEKSQNQDSGDSPSFDLTRFLRNPFAPSGSRDNLFESFESKLEQTLNQIGLVLHGFYKVLIKENTLVLKEIIECLYLLTESARTLFQGKIFDCLKLIDSFHESIGSINIQEVSAKFNQIIELIRVLSMEALYNREYQNRTSKIKNKESFSSRVLELEKCYSPCLSIDKEHMQDIDDKLLMKIKTELTLKSLQEFLKTYSISESQIVSGSEICRICLNRVNNIDLQHHVKKCSEKYKTEKQLEEVRGEIISLRQGMKNREIQLRNTINKLTDNPPGSDGKTHLALHIFECLLRDLDKRSYKNYYSKPREVILQSKQFQNLLIQDQQLIGKQELLQRYSNLFHQQKELKSIIMKLECQNFKGSETDSKRSKYSQKRSLDTFEVKTPRKKSNKKSRFAAISKEQEDDSGKPNCYFPDKGNQLSLVRKHSSEKYIHDYEQDFKFKNFEVLKLLGKGAFGRVYLVRRIYTRDLYAMKVIPIQSAQYALIKNQHDIFAKISGDSFVRAVFSFTEGNLHMFFLEFMNGGDFSQLLERQVYLEEAQSRYYFAEIALAIEKLHETGIIHRDIKPSNIVLDSSGYLKLTDFGLSKLGITHVVKHSEEICKAKKAEEQLMAVQVHCPSPGLTRKGSYQKKTLLGPHAGTNKRIIGTPDYIAPEIIRQQSFDNPSIDWWSYGVIIYQALIGTKPFGAMKVQDVFSNILQNKIIWPQIGYDQGMISPQAQDFIKKLLQPDFTKRLGYNGISQIKSHKFWQGLNWNNVSSMIPPIRFPSEDVSLMEENIDLKKEIYQMIKKQTKLGSQKRLKSLVRLDVLSEITLSRASISSNGNRRRARKSCFAQLRQ